MNKALYFEGIATVGGNILPGAVAFEITENLLSVEHKRGDGKGNIPIPAGKEIKGKVTFTEINQDVLSTITGGTITDGTYKRVRYGEETQTISSTKITLNQGADTIEDTIELIGDNGTRFRKVSSSPNIGEYSYDATSGECSFNASEPAKTIYPSYLYADSTTGKTLSFGTDLPDDMELYGTMRSKDMDDAVGGTSSMSDATIHLTHIIRQGEVKIGGESGGGNTNEISFEFTAIISKNTDAQFSFDS